MYHSAAAPHGISRLGDVEASVARAQAATARLGGSAKKAPALTARAAAAASRLAASLNHAAEMLKVNSVRARIADETLSRAEMLASIAERRIGAVLRAGSATADDTDAADDNNACGVVGAADASVHDLEVAAAQASALADLLERLPATPRGRDRLHSEEAPDSAQKSLSWLAEVACLAPDAQSVPWAQFTDALGWAAADDTAAAAADALQQELDPAGEDRVSLQRLMQVVRGCGCGDGAVTAAALAGALHRAADIARPDIVSPISGKAAAGDALSGGQPGAFLVRFSRSTPGAFAASYIADSGACEHFLLRPHPGGGLVAASGAVYPSLRRALLAQPHRLRHFQRAPQALTEPEYRCVALAARVAGRIGA